MTNYKSSVSSALPARNKSLRKDAFSDWDELSQQTTPPRASSNPPQAFQIWGLMMGNFPQRRSLSHSGGDWSTTGAEELGLG